MIKLYGIPSCFNCTIAKKMLDKRNIKYEYIKATDESMDLPCLEVNGKRFYKKEALQEIRQMQANIE